MKNSSYLCGKAVLKDRATQPALTVRTIRAQPPGKHEEIFSHSRPTRFNQVKSPRNKSTVRAKGPGIYSMHSYPGRSSQSSSPPGTHTSQSRYARRVRPRLGLSHGTPLASRGVHGVRGLLSSCIWNLGVFPDDARASHCPFVLTSFTGWSSKRSG